MIGNCLGASSGLEAIATVKAITTRWLHPSINQFNPEPLVEFDTVAKQKKQHEVNVDDEAKAQSGERSKHYAKIGWSKNQEIAKTNPKLAAMNKKFGMIHGLSSLARIFRLICLLLYIGLNVDCIHFD
ncbi:hypothetical protein Goshw_004515 [Gossypium schwendimanii]|uniref:beta-ketoacyl-[acyl-carrier-protein] synthase I n=1 Tax=Gossypium schwendimanii TaxID=34291 RepID=A0A7J9NFG7_GOSSC|nr:hypothetical protein [Gossypium schwendimanii]